VWDNILLGSEAALAHYGNHTTLYMNDDFFCMDPTGSVLPVRRDQTLAEHVEYVGDRAGGLWWHRSLALTASWLNSQGFDRPDSYEVHRPFVAHPAQMAQALSQWDHGIDPDMVPQWRTVCGVFGWLKAYPVADPKIKQGVFAVGTPWLSTDDKSWREYGAFIAERFQKPSRWELF
jgi:hypothetical protein